jgi:hypothetical protein
MYVCMYLLQSSLVVNIVSSQSQADPTEKERGSGKPMHKLQGKDSYDMNNMSQCSANLPRSLSYISCQEIQRPCVVSDLHGARGLALWPPVDKIVYPYGLVLHAHVTVSPCMFVHAWHWQAYMVLVCASEEHGSLSTARTCVCYTGFTILALLVIPLPCVIFG